MLTAAGTSFSFRNTCNPFTASFVIALAVVIFTVTMEVPLKYRRSTFLSLPVDDLRSLINLHLSVPKIADYYGVSIKTVRRRMDDAGIRVRDTYADLRDDELDTIVAGIALANPNLGFRLIKGILWTDKGIRVADRRLKDCIRRIDPLGVAGRLQANRAVYRRQYHVPYSNFLWHIDTYCKLNHFNLIVRSGIDGKSRLCVYLEAGTNNKASASMASFLEGVKKYNVPSHCRSDKGSETVLISRFMLMARGLQGHFTGKSTRNQRIERFWGDTKKICSHYYDTMRELEDLGWLDIDNTRHMNILHKVFVPRLNASLETFRQGWNNHPLSTEGNKTPNQLFLLHANTSGSQRYFNWDEVEALTEMVMRYAPPEEPVDSVRYLHDIDYVLTAEEEQALTHVDVLRDSTVNGKDVFFECMRLIGEL